MPKPTDPGASDTMARLRAEVGVAGRAAAPEPPADPTRFDTLPAFRQFKLIEAAGKALGLRSPYFRQAEAVDGPRVRIGGRWITGFASYDYLSINRSPAIAEAVAAAARDWGGSATGSRIGGGECTYHEALETALAAFLGTEAALTFVSGHATNEAILRTLTGPGDLIVMDELCHNSIYEGARASGAAWITFPHNDWARAAARLSEIRHRHDRALVIVEGLYSMDGDTPDLARFVELKREHRAWLMVDEAHSIGVLGATGRGLCEAAGVSRDAIDITMGTLSKSLSACGGVVAGRRTLIDLLRHAAPGSVYSVAMAPSVAAAARAALALIEAEPERLARLAANGRHFLATARRLGLDCGTAQGHAIGIVMVGDSLRAARASDALFAQGYAVTPVLAPAVPDRAARLRLFLTADHRPEQIDDVLTRIARLLDDPA
ncbi:aminotransferase class I/II-fold pyridoxal phosphate-dependent enzyme [Palleronia sediminis]|nr:aminotransferase class I/II-fold pyridoxal phosphate-dependent enzyme [Palleronia sediminis]